MPTGQQTTFDYRVRPIPNLLFMRDPAAVVGHGYNISFMATWAREREPLILDYVFRHHPRLRHLKETDRLFDQLTPLLRGRIRMPQSLEGGDTLVLSDKVIAVGCSERSSADAIHMLAESLRRDHLPGRRQLRDPGHGPDAQDPQRHAPGHRVHPDQPGRVPGYPPFFTEESRELLNVVKFDLRHEQLHTEVHPSLLRVLKGEGIDLRPIFCGGRDPILQQREQWTDGANAFALAPGVIVLYSRNLATADELAAAGYRVGRRGELDPRPVPRPPGRPQARGPAGQRRTEPGPGRPPLHDHAPFAPCLLNDPLMEKVRWAKPQGDPAAPHRSGQLRPVQGGACPPPRAGRP